MSTRLPQGTVAFITGIARGQGRSHAIRLAEEGADIIGVDIAAPAASNSAPPSTPEDLAETVRLVEALDRRIVTAQLNVNDLDDLTTFVDDAVADLGRLDVVVANAGVTGGSDPVHEISAEVWRDVLDTNLTGVFNTLKVSIPHMIAGGRGGSIIITSSSIALRGAKNLAHYGAAKTGLIGLMRIAALEVAPHSIRVNTLHPGTVSTPMILNPSTYAAFRPDLDEPTLEDVEPVFRSLNALPIPWVEERDISNAVLFLASPEARFITGATLPVDGGCALL